MATDPMYLGDNSTSLADLAEAATLDEAAELRIEVQGRSVTLTGDAARAVVHLLRILGAGSAVSIDALPAVLTTGQAADLLGVSRPTVVALIDSGRLPATLVGTHRRVQLGDALAYRERQNTTRRQALRKLTHVSEELGLYDDA